MSVVTRSTKKPKIEPEPSEPTCGFFNLQTVHQLQCVGIPGYVPLYCIAGASKDFEKWVRDFVERQGFDRVDDLIPRARFSDIFYQYYGTDKRGITHLQRLTDFSKDFMGFKVPFKWIGTVCNLWDGIKSIHKCCDADQVLYCIGPHCVDIRYKMSMWDPDSYVSPYNDEKIPISRNQRMQHFQHYEKITFNSYSLYFMADINGKLGFILCSTSGGFCDLTYQFKQASAFDDLGYPLDPALLDVYLDAD
jgi:hypothetical protein